MRKWFITTLAAVFMVAWNTTAEVETPWVNNVLYEMEQEPVDEVEWNAALGELHFSIKNGEECNPQPGDPIEAVLDLCEAIGVPDLMVWDLSTHKYDYLQQVDMASLTVILQDLYDLMIDTDGDGWVDSEDAYPNDPAQWQGFVIPGEHDH